jgi:hypothetical protein
MERIIVSVAPESNGWRIECAERTPIVLKELQSAIVKASHIARDENRSRGMPTAVKVKMTCGDGVMMAFHG